MNGRCNALSLDVGALLSQLEKLAETGQRLEGDVLMQIMKREARMTTHGESPGKPAWRDDIADGIKRQETRKVGNGIGMDFGYVPRNEAELVRAMVVTEGSGKAVGNPPITAGPEGRSVWDGDVTGRHPSRAKDEYALPDAFNQTGNQWLLDALMQMDGRYGEQQEMVFSTIASYVFFGNVRVLGG